jgi:hypothetical protein
MPKKSMRGEDDMVKAIAAAKAKKKSRTFKIGEMLDKLELEQAPRRPFISKAPPKKSKIPASPTR